MKYTIITPTKNRANIIWKSIRSVINQDFSDWELLIVDGKSKDGTDKLVTAFNDQRVKYILNENDTGVSSARNMGIKMARGEYIAYLDSDDFVYTDWLSTIDSHIKKEPDKKIFMPNKNFKVNLLNNDGTVQKTFIESLLFEKDIFSYENIISLKIQCDTNGMIHSRETINKVGYWNEELDLYEDFEFLLRHAEFFPNAFSYIPQVLVNYTRSYGKDSLCSKATYKKIIDSINNVYELHGKKDFLKDQTWHNNIVTKYTPRIELENKGVTILDHLIEKYGKE